MAISCSIFIRTYWKDMDWLALCLQSIFHHCRGFEEVVVTLPEASLPWLARQPLHAGVRIVTVGNFRDDYLGQQVTKLHADDFLDCDFIAHLDADCMITRPTRPEDLLDDGRACIFTRPVQALGRHNPWRQPTESFLGHEVEYDFMQRPPFIYPRWLYGEVRRHCLDLHGMPLDSYVMSRPVRGFSEFNALGAYAHHHHPREFTFISVDDAAAQERICCDWHWSWGGLSADIRRRVEANLAAWSPA